MLDRVQSSVTGRCAAVVENVLAKHGLERAPAVEAELGRFGMTSIDMVELMFGVEAEFDLSIPPTEITPENFRSIAAIAALVSRLSPQL